jgi:cell division septum initiation protein DivIVA
MNKRSQRGAARVPAVWMIVVIVLFFASLGFAWVSNQDAVTFQKVADDAVAARATAEADYSAELDKTREISKVLGFYNREVLGAISDVTTAGDGLNSLRAVINMPESVQDYEKAVQPVIDALRQKDTELSNLRTQLTNTEGRLSAAQQANQTISSELQGKLNKASQDYSDLEQQSGDEKARMENDIAQLRSTVNQLNSDLVSEKGSNDDLQETIKRDGIAATTRAAALNRQLKVLKETPGPDGEVLAVSRSLMTGWINRGAADRVSRGMVFEIRTGNPDPARQGQIKGRDALQRNIAGKPNPALQGKIKGWAEVTIVEEHRSQVRIFDEADAYDPVGARDKIYNPLFDPTGDRYAVLVGTFSGRYNGADVRALLESVGITVQGKLHLTTNYLIMGGAVSNEDGEIIQPWDLPKYREAQAQGVYIISINQFAQYFKK